MEERLRYEVDKDKAEVAAKEKAEEEKAQREKAEKEQAEKEKAQNERAVKAKADKEKAEKEDAARKGNDANVEPVSANEGINVVSSNFIEKASFCNLQEK